MTDSFSILQTKLYRPPTPVEFVPRPVLIKQLDRHRSLPLTLVSAPAGYGKTTLVSSWLESLDVPSAWYSLDKGDSDLNLFLVYFLAGLREKFPGAAEDTLSLVKSPEQTPTQVLTNSLANDLSQVPDDFVFVLDDFHAVRFDSEIHDLIAALLRYPPPTMHLVLATRGDPPIDLVQQRALGRMTEIRAQELRFSQADVALYLRHLLNRDVDEETVFFLTQKSEGWVTGIRLLALSLRRLEDANWNEIDRLESNQMVEDYLMSIILSLQEPAFEECLLRAAVLDRFCAPLCDAICETDWGSSDEFNGELFIEKLTGSNLFVTSLDAQQHWFRYHHLFHDLLLRELERERGQPFINELHRRASGWFAANGFVDEALQHALAAGDTEVAISLVAQYRHDLMNREEWRRLDRWLKQFPVATIQESVELLLAKLYVNYYFWYDLTGTMQTFELLDSRLESRTFESGEITRYSAEVAAVRSHFHYWFTDGAAGATAAQKALDSVPLELECVYTSALGGKGITQQMLGELEDAVHSVRRPLQDRTFQYPSSNARLLFTLCIVYWCEGDLTNLREAAARLLKLCETYDMTLSSAYAHYYLGIIHYERNELDEAEKHLGLILQHPYRYGMVNVCQAALPLGFLYMSRRQSKKARETQRLVADLAFENQNDLFIGLAEALRAELDRREGNIQAAVNWAQGHKPSQLTSMQRFYVPDLNYIKILLAQNTPDNHEDIDASLTRLEDHAKRINATTTLFKMLIIRALFTARQADEALALATLERAVHLAEPGGFIRQFVDLGSEMADMLRQLQERGVSPGYIARILAAYPAAEPVRLLVAQENLIEPLTNRELEILALLAARKTNQEIADELVISLSTVKQHTHNIYQKLQVKNRRHAVAKAAEFGLITPA